MKESKKDCGFCHGRGEIRVSASSGNNNPSHRYRTYGTKAYWAPCHVCHGSGKSSRADEDKGSNIFSTFIYFCIFIIIIVVVVDN